MALAASLGLLGPSAGLAACGQAPTAATHGPQGRHSAGAARPPVATTSTTIAGAPRDSAAAAAFESGSRSGSGSGSAPASTAAWQGTVVHPVRPVTVYDRPDGAAIAELPSTQLGGPTWVPVVETAGGWHRVLLPSRPNGSTGWIRVRPGLLRAAHSPYLVEVGISSRRLLLTRDGRPAGSWTVAVGAPQTPTPTGRTFVLAAFVPDEHGMGPLVLALGTHSQTLERFGGGPGTVAFHGWPDPSVFGAAVTHGCVRVPPAALRNLSRVPLGTVVLIKP